MNNMLISIIMAVCLAIPAAGAESITAVDISHQDLTGSRNLSSSDTGSYRIALTMPDHADSFVTLGYHLGDKQYIKDTIPTDINGRALFAGDKKLEQGLYMVILPENSYFEMIIGDDQIFDVFCKKSDMINSLEFTGSEENSSFLQYQKGWRHLQEQNGKLRRRLEENKQNADSTEILLSARTEMENSMVAYLQQYADDYKGTILSALLKAMIPVTIPEFNIPFDSPDPDSLRWVYSYYHTAQHFFDNISLTDSRLIRTPLLYNKLNTFFTSVIIPQPDTVIKNMHRIIKMAEPEPEVYRLVIVYLFNHFRESQIMGHDAVIVELADNYYLNGRAPWAGEAFIKDLRRDTELLRNNIIGKKGVDLTMETFDGMWKSLYDLKAEYTIIYFWEPDCGHCKTATPMLRDLYNRLKGQGIEVFAVFTQDDREKWINYISENTLTWINVWDPLRQTRFDYYYNVNSTPMAYILDSEKTIIAKKLPVEKIEEFISTHRMRGR